MNITITQAIAVQGAAHLAASARRLARKEVAHGWHEAHLARAEFYEYITAVICPGLGFTPQSRQETLPGVGHPHAVHVVRGFVYEPKVIIATRDAPAEETL